ncbi:MAG: hypothetical protein WBZ36_19600 [Candidatus Nitrosopolaris sp.]
MRCLGTTALSPALECKLAFHMGMLIVYAAACLRYAMYFSNERTLLSWLPVPKRSTNNDDSCYRVLLIGITYVYIKLHQITSPPISKEVKFKWEQRDQPILKGDLMENKYGKFVFKKKDLEIESNDGTQYFVDPEKKFVTGESLG